ncbi:MAG: hypothetical protein KKA22_04305 [Gammaproteobacteria bacterium]|nr:hypothetical protein [Gammaproteobacteria bacterium]MBU1407351.1 hypothetical protein [Gammaproteobacteria bacterium]MBU1531464.1 hypothetical protein [Gammaproteobacteria bacterium]
MNQLKQYLKVAQWFLKGKPVPPPHLIKQKAILKNANRYNTRIMVETGTLLGDMVEAMKNHFTQIYSIEISPELARKAQQRFANDSHISIIENDSSVALKSLMPEIREPALFWLDGHYSGGNTGKGEKDTPIMEELATIYASDIPHVVLIDDARCFGAEKDYPSLDKLSAYIKSLRPNASISVTNDCIVVAP